MIRPAIVAVSISSLALIQAAEDSAIPGWRHAGMNGKEYEIVLNHDVVRGGSASARLSCPKKHCPGFVTLSQVVRPGEYEGRRVRLSGWIKGKDAGKARLWMRIDGPGGAIFQFDNMENRSKHGTFDWVEMHIALDVSPSAQVITFGVMLQDKGAIWADDLTLETVKRNVKSTNTLQGFVPNRDSQAAFAGLLQKAKPVPVNLDFEDVP